MSKENLISASAALDGILESATRDDLIKALKAASLIVAEHDRLHGTISLDPIQQAMNNGVIDDEMEELLIRGYEYLAGILGRSMQSASSREVVH